jgi:hypothetical protein
MSERSKDEHYILEICDELLGEKGERQKRFDFLRGFPSLTTGRRAPLPVDAFSYLYVRRAILPILMLLLASNADAGGYKPEESAIDSVCSLKIGSVYNFAGACWTYIDSDGSFRFNSKTQNVFAYVNRTPDEDYNGHQTALAYWNGGVASRAQDHLGVVLRQGSSGCWETDLDKLEKAVYVKICANRR